MNYEEKYKKGLSFLKDLKPHMSDYCIEKLEGFFPELRESEDEMIRKDIVEYLKSRGASKRWDFNIWIAWLENQKETEAEDFGEFINELSKQFPEVSFAKLSRIAVRVKNWLEKKGEQKAVKSEQSCYHNDGLYYAIDILEKTFGKVEGYQSDDGKAEHQTAIETVNALYHKKPTEWSEEDERMCQETIDWFEKKCFPYALESENPARESIKWLKSLKPQNKWKPSEEQMKALNAINLLGELSYVGQGEILVRLYNELKKL